MKLAIAAALVLILASHQASANFDVGCGDVCLIKLPIGELIFNCPKESTCTGGRCMGGKCPGMKGDPELRGLDGRNFYFDGEADKNFNFISEQNHQVNAYFVEGPHKIAALGSEGEHNGTYVGALGFKVYDTKLEVATDEEGEMTVKLNGEPVVLDAANEFEFNADLGKVNVTVYKYNPEFGQTVHLTSDLYNFFVYVTPKQWDEAEEQVTRGHLNLALAVDQIKYFSSDIHGVLGQISPDSAADNSLLPPELGIAFLGEGSDNDYIVSDLFADDFKFNRFGVPSTKMGAGTVSTVSKSMKIAASRRHLSSHTVEPAVSREANWIIVKTGFSGVDN